MFVLVTGMHRSGTSALAELLIEGGLYGGRSEELMPPSLVNRRGFFERLDIVDLNDRLLRSVDAHWLAPPLTTDGLLTLAAGPLGDEARRIMTELDASGREVMLKDPRFCLTLPFWREVLAERLRAVVIVFRDPTEVAASLRKRDGIAESIGVHLWTAYYEALLANIAGLDFFPVEYEELFRGPTAALGAVEDAIHDFSTERALASRTLDASLYHHHADHEMLTGSAGELFGYLRSLVPGKGTDDGPVNGDKAVALALGVAAVSDREARREIEVLVGERDEARAQVEEQSTVFIAERDEARAALNKVHGAAQLREAKLQHEIDSVHAVVNETTERLESERDQAREVHRLTGQELARTARRLSDYERSRAAGFARRLWATKRRLRAVKDRARPALRGSGERAEQTQHQIINASILEPVHLPLFDEPVVSIVVPIHGELSMTAGCLASIKATTNQVPYEVIVVDDASPDDSAVWLDRCTNVQVVANSVNRGFLRSTNAGVDAAQGQYVCLLNNDTEVQPGWLEALLRGFAGVDDVGAVGAKLVYPDGKLQEAGGIVFSDGSGWNYGRTGDPDEPDVNFLRDVDYCSAACLLVRKSCWDAIGGFDERFAPAYYEDTDLAFALREHGWRVLYQPGAVVTHFEGASHGTDETQGLKAYQEQNKLTFQAKWASRLSEQRAPGSSPRVASWRGDAKRVLVIDHEVPAADQDSGSVRMLAILQLIIEAGLKVSFLPFNRFQREPYCSDLQSRGIEVLYGASSVEGHLENLREDLAFVIVSRPDVAAEFMPLLANIAPEVPVVYDMVDFHGLRLQRRSEITGDESDLDESINATMMERTFARNASHVLAITDSERDLLRELEPDASISVLPNIHRSPRSTSPFEERNGVLFVGSYRHVPNQDAIEWLMDEILPEIWERDSGIVFHLVGSDLPDELSNIDDARIEVHGWLPHLDEVFDRVRVTIAPLRFGAGLKGKVGDSLMRGVPCVATDVGAEGFGPVADVLLVANASDELAELVVRAHNDQADWDERSTKGAYLVENHFGYSAARMALANLIDDLDVTVTSVGVGGSPQLP